MFGIIIILNNVGSEGKFTRLSAARVPAEGEDTGTKTPVGNIKQKSVYGPIRVD